MNVRVFRTSVQTFVDRVYYKLYKSYSFRMLVKIWAKTEQRQWHSTLLQQKRITIYGVVVQFVSIRVDGLARLGNVYSWTALLGFAGVVSTFRAAPHGQHWLPPPRYCGMLYRVLALCRAGSHRFVPKIGFPATDGVGKLLPKSDQRNLTGGEYVHVTNMVPYIKTDIGIEIGQKRTE